MVTPERIYFIGGTGNVGSVAIIELLKNQVPVTVYARSIAKAQKLFGNDPNLTMVKGDVNDLKPFEESISGHSRLFLVITDFANHMKLKVDIARRAYAAGVKQIVDMSSISVNFPWRSTLNSVVSRTTEESILAIPNRGTYIALRPYFFMSNHLQPGLFNSTRDSNTIIDIYEPDEVQEWISTNDMGVIIANIFQDPVEKHGDAVYELIGDVVSLKNRAALLSKILGRTFTYKKVTPQEQYNYLTQTQGLPHSVAYAFLYQPATTGKPSPGLSVLLGRSPETLEQWIEANKANIP